MSDAYRLLTVDEAPRVTSEKSGTETTDLTAELDLQELRARVWHLEPGHDRKPLHRHETQEELFYLLEGPGRIQVGDETLEVEPGTAIKFPPATPRRVFNDADEPAVWLIVGAPPVAHDGVVLEGS
jgi:quercetin dioxygenase-like cupin family protein